MPVRVAVQTPHSKRSSNPALTEVTEGSDA